tara:strand:- start:449 stop:1009 length:561 start_codon:yes stop_codon:yes gene_type:complete
MIAVNTYMNVFTSGVIKAKDIRLKSWPPTKLEKSSMQYSKINSRAINKASEKNSDHWQFLVMFKDSLNDMLLSSATPTKISDSLNVKNKVTKKKVKGITPIKMLYMIRVNEAPINMLGIIHKAKNPMLYKRYLVSRLLNFNLKGSGCSSSKIVRVVFIEIIARMAMSATKKSIYKSELALPYENPV